MRGKLNTTKLSPGIQYEVVFVVKLQAKAYGWEVPVNLKLNVPHASENRWSKVNLTDKAREHWIEIPVGDFTASPKNLGTSSFHCMNMIRDGRLDLLSKVLSFGQFTNNLAYEQRDDVLVFSFL